MRFNLTSSQKSFSSYAMLVFATMLIFVVVRLFEMEYAVSFLGMDIDLELLVTRSINFDSLFILLTSTLLGLPILGIGFVNEKAAIAGAKIILFLFVVTNIILTGYFLINNSLLTGVVLDFSLSTLFEIIQSEFSVNRLWIWIGALLVILFSVILLQKVSKSRESATLNRLIILVYLALVIIGVFNRKHTFKAIHHFETKQAFLLGNSKHVYFLRSLDQLSGNTTVNQDELLSAINTYQNSRPDFDFIDSSYPLIHNEPYENVLGPYFPKASELPNIVLIISESLSSSYSGDATALQSSLTPNTDSLAASGLNWTRFFSNEDRSFAVLPNILASLPAGIGERGFINMKLEGNGISQYPRHNNLIDILNQNGYQTNYFYGGWGQFDNTETYVKELGVDFYLSRDNFNKKKYKEVDGGWGYNDKDLYSQSLDILADQNSSQPTLNIYQTITVHSPFNLAEPSYYEESYLEPKLESIGMKDDAVGNLPSDILASIFYADDALKYLVSMLSQQNGFRETIFIITGDHSINLNLTSHSFENFHVPLIIWSPMIKAPAEFKGASSHLDILPSLLALLQGNFGMPVSSAKHWVGQGLDTSSHYSFQRTVPFKLTSMELPNFMYNNEVFYGGKEMKIDSSLTLTVDHTQPVMQVEKVYQSYRTINRHVCGANRISK